MNSKQIIKTMHELAEKSRELAHRDTHYICTVCNKRWGNETEGSELELSKCDKHQRKLSPAEIHLRGTTVGELNSRERLKEIKNRGHKPA